MTGYVAGLLFNPDYERVALVRKNRPDWQAGRLNAIGGHIEPGEASWIAMFREFYEEAGVAIGNWEYFAKVSGPWGFRRLLSEFEQPTTPEPFMVDPVSGLQP